MYQTIHNYPWNESPRSVARSNRLVMYHNSDSHPNASQFQRFWIDGCISETYRRPWAVHWTVWTLGSKLHLPINCAVMGTTLCISLQTSRRKIFETQKLFWEQLCNVPKAQQHRTFQRLPMKALHCPPCYSLDLFPAKFICATSSTKNPRFHISGWIRIFGNSNGKESSDCFLQDTFESSNSLTNLEYLVWLKCWYSTDAWPTFLSK